MPAALMLHETDPKSALADAIGPLDDIEVFHNQVLVAVYKRPEKTRGGIFLTDQNRDEDRFQGKVGMVLKLGPSAFKPSDEWTWPADIGAGDWVFLRTSESWACTVNGQDCRLVDDTSIRGRLSRPDLVW